MKTHTNKFAAADTRETDIAYCARCQGNHQKILFKKLELPCGDLTHWAICPISREPILLRLTGDKAILDENRFVLGDIRMARLPEGKIWMEIRQGEGMEISEKELEAALRKIFNEKF